VHESGAPPRLEAVQREKHENETVSVSFDNVVADHLAASSLYKSTVREARQVVAAICSSWRFSALAAGVRWWTVIFSARHSRVVPPAFSQPLVVRRGFKHNPKFRETYHVTFD
jgi:hypothetical protein